MNGKVFTFEEGLAFLSEGKRCLRARRKLCNNTYMEVIDENTIGIKLHNTYVVKIRANGIYEVNSGGWQTVTTKSRINMFSPVSISQEKFEWFVYLRDRSRVPFEDGMEFTADGKLIENYKPACSNHLAWA